MKIDCLKKYSSSEPSLLNNSYTLTIDTASKFVTIDGSLSPELQWQCVDDDEFTMTTTIHCDSDMLYPVLSKAPALLSQQTLGIYFYHPDHLGSATWISDDECNPVEYVHYMPYGELWSDQRTSTYSERFRFTGKERDTETGYDYFGARYYSSILPAWLSVDPLAGDYPNTSPYVYCANNPIKNIDPDGNRIVFATGTTSTQKKHFLQAISHLNNHGCGGRYTQLRDSRYTYTVNMNAEKSQFIPNKQTINWNPEMGIETDNGTIMSPTTVLNHEMTHATHYDDAVEQYNKGNTHAFEEYNNSLLPNTSENYGSLEEERVIKGIEQRTVRALGEVGEGEVSRTNHEGKPVRVESSISNKKIYE